MMKERKTIEDFTDIEKDKLLLIHKFEKMTGWAMEYSAPESESIIITVDEVRKFIGTKATNYYTEEHGEMGRDLEDAWECLVDMSYNITDAESDNDVIKYLEKQLKTSTHDNEVL